MLARPVLKHPPGRELGIALFVLGLLCSGWGTALAAPRHMAARSPAIHLSTDGSCPDSLGEAADVSNAAIWQRHELVPPQPVRGLICRYEAPLGSGAEGQRTGMLLYGSARLAARSASRLAGAIRRIHTRMPKGPTSCPAGFDQSTVIAFAYGGSGSADLWYQDSGCPTLDNGWLGAFESGNPPFYQGFAPLLDRLCPPRTGGQRVTTSPAPLPPVTPAAPATG